MKHKELRYLLTQDCNYDCFFCAKEGLHEKVPTELTLKDYTYLFTTCRDNFDWKTISFTGGEPLMYHGFDNLVKEIARLQGRIKIISNGELLDEHLDAIDLLEQANISLHTLDEQKYDRLVNKTGKLQRVKDGIKLVTANSPHVEQRLNIVLARGFNESPEDVKNILDFAEKNNCSIKFIELGGNTEKLVPLDEIQTTIRNLGIRDNKINGMDILYTRLICEDSQRFPVPSQACNYRMGFFVTPSGAINKCHAINDCESILDEIKNRDDEQLVSKLVTINESFGKNCLYDRQLLSIN